MSYCTTDDCIRAAGGPDRLAQLTDLENTGQRDDAVLADAISIAEGMVNSYAEVRYHVAFDGTAPAVIRRLTADEAVYILKQRRGAVSDLDATAHAERVVWLEGLAAGKVSPGEDPRPAGSTRAARGGWISRGNSEDGDLALTKSNLKGVW